MLRIRADEEVDRLQVGGTGPLLEEGEVSRLISRPGDVVHLRRIEEVDPLRRQAARLADHPPRPRGPGPVRRTGVGVGRLEESRSRAGMDGRPGAARLDNLPFPVAYEREAAGDDETADERPRPGPAVAGLLVEERQLGGRGTEEPRPGLQPVGRVGRRVERVEPDRGVVVMEGVVEAARRVLVVAEHPVLGLRVRRGQGVEAPVEDRVGRLPPARHLDHMAGVPVAGDAVRQGGDQGGRIDLAVPDRIPERGRRRHELGLPADEVLALGDVAPAGIAVEGVVLSDVGDELAGGAVVEAEAADVELAERLVVLAPLVDVEPVPGVDQETADAGARRGAHEGDVPRPLGHGKEVRQPHQVAEEDLKPAVGERRVEEVALLPAAGPELLVDLDLHEEVGRARVHLDLPDALELGAELEGVPDDRLDVVVELLPRREGRGIEVGSKDGVERRGGVDGVVFGDPAHPAAAVERAFVLVLVGTG